MDAEQPQNGQAEQRQRRRPLSADAELRATAGLSHSHSLGLRDSQSSPKTRQSPQAATPNSYRNNDSNDSAKQPSTTTKRKGKGRPCNAWELPALIRPLPVRRRPATAKKRRILPHYDQVVEFVHTHRYATGYQIQQCFSQQMRSERTRAHQLAALVDLGYLAIAPVRSTAPHFPFVYLATDRGVRFVRKTRNAACPPPTEEHRRRGQAMNSLLHELLTTEFDLLMRRSVAQDSQLRSCEYQRRYFQAQHRIGYEHQGVSGTIAPDSGTLVRYASGRCQLHLVELDNGTMSWRRIQEKMEKYDRWVRGGQADYLRQLYASHGWSPQRPTLRLLFIVHANGRGESDDHRLTDLLLLVLDASAALRRQVWFTTTDALNRVHDETVPLASAVWVRARDAHRHFDQYQVRHGRGPKALRNKRKQLLKLLAEVPRTALFDAPGERTRCGKLTCAAGGGGAP